MSIYFVGATLGRPGICAPSANTIAARRSYPPVANSSNRSGDRGSPLHWFPISSVLRRNGTSHRKPRHCEAAGRGNLLVDHADRNHPAGDCHVASLLAMTCMFGGWSFCFRQAVIQPGRRGRCRTPCGTNSICRALTSHRSGGFGSPVSAHKVLSPKCQRRLTAKEKPLTSNVRGFRSCWVPAFT